MHSISYILGVEDGFTCAIDAAGASQGHYRPFSFRAYDCCENVWIHL
jgi:hypothetical protein